MQNIGRAILGSGKKVNQVRPPSPINHLRSLSCNHIHSYKIASNIFRLDERRPLTMMLCDDLVVLRRLFCTKSSEHMPSRMLDSVSNVARCEESMLGTISGGAQAEKTPHQLTESSLKAHARTRETFEHLLPAHYRPSSPVSINWQMRSKSPSDPR